MEVVGSLAGRERSTEIMTKLFYAGPPLQVLHEEYAKNGRIDQQAPVTTACEVNIRAPREAGRAAYVGLPLNRWDRKWAQRSRFQPGREVPDDSCRSVRCARHDPACLQ